MAEINHMLRFGTHAEGKYFLGKKNNSYETVVFNANMVAYTQSAIAAFIVSITPQGKRFFIDPQTHAFQHDPSYLKSTNSAGKQKPKKSIELLAMALGEPVSSLMKENKPLRTVDFDDPDLVKSFSKRTIDFQENILNSIKDQDDWKYLDYMLTNQKLDAPSPKGLIAPYFYMSDRNYQKWIEVNMSFVTASKEYAGDKLTAQLVISKDILQNDTAIDTIAKSYADSDAKTILIWVDSFDETSASQGDLKGFIRLIKLLKDKNKTVINLYGGYFSVLLGAKGLLDGVCHGLEYGESRAVVPVGGGIPMAKYYFPPLHFRMRYADLVGLYTSIGWDKDPKEFVREVCQCSQCSNGSIEKYGITKPVRTRRGSHIITLNYPTAETKHVSLLHYLYTKNTEFTEASSRDMQKLAKQLVDAADKYEEYLGEDSVSHARLWSDVIMSIK